MINGEENEPEAHLAGFPNIPKHHLTIRHIYTPTLPRGGKCYLFSAAKKKNAHFTHPHFPPPSSGSCSNTTPVPGEGVSSMILEPAGRVQEKISDIACSVKFIAMQNCRQQEIHPSTIPSNSLRVAAFWQKEASCCKKSPLWVLQSTNGVVKIGKTNEVNWGAK